MTCPSSVAKQKKFCKANVSLENADLHYEQAVSFQDEAIKRVVARFMGKNVQNVSPHAPIVANGAAQFWANATPAIPSEHSKHWSVLVSEIGNAQMK